MDPIKPNMEYEDAPTLVGDPTLNPPPKTPTEAFQLPALEEWDVREFGNWVRRRHLRFAYAFTQDRYIMDNPWAWESHWDHIIITKGRSISFRGNPQQWIITDGKTWRVADSLESDDDE